MLDSVATHEQKHGDNKRFYLSAATVDRRSLSSDKIMEEENGH